MYYSEFNEILESIYAMDSDVISIEASRSKGEIIEKFEEIHYDHSIRFRSLCILQGFLRKKK
jgi:5-methyltetrahydropteroyltriglutamate--homocysteine methyltransferase